jgi:hypothetical protein
MHGIAMDDDDGLWPIQYACTWLQGIPGSQATPYEAVHDSQLFGF